MKIKSRKVFSFFLCIALLINILPANRTLAATSSDVYALSYHVGAYDMFPESDGSISVMIDGKKYYYSDDFDDGEIATKISKMENQNVVYELHDNKIVKVYTMDEVLSQEVIVEPSIKDGVTYRKGKFSQKSFDLVVKISNNLQEDFKKNDLLWFLSGAEKDCLYSTLKKLEIEPSDKVDFGSSGWWMWKEYERTISENVNDLVKVEETKEYKYTVNLHNDGVLNEREYDIVLYITPTFDTGVGRRAEGKIPVGNLDYQEERTEEKKLTSNSGKSVTQASTKLNGIQNAIQFSKDYFSADQTEQINEFVNMWMSELLLAKYVDKSDLKEKVSEKIANELLKKLGLDTSILAIPGEIRATTYLETQTKDGTKVFIQFDINLLDFDFGNSGMPTMATGSGTATVYNMDGVKLDSSVILPAYADVCAFCEQLQKVAKDTIFSGAKEYLGIFGISAESTAEALSSQIMVKVLNNKYTKDTFKMVDAKDVKAAIKKIITDGEKNVNKKIFKLITTPSKGSTEVSVKCPVDVKIYDNDGKLCGEVKNNVVNSSYDDIFVTVVGDQKNIYLVGDDYSFEMTGTDDGSMDYVIREFDDEGNTTREITYENIKLSNGCKYYSFVPEAENHISTLFDLTDSEGNVISPTKGADVDSNIDKIGGECGDNVYWELSDDGILRIYGNGNMYDYGTSDSTTSGGPWRKLYNDKITSIVIEEGVTNVGSSAFYYCKNLGSVNISNTVTSINAEAFYCSGLTKIDIPNSVKTIENGVFESCKSLSEIHIPESVENIGSWVFESTPWFENQKDEFVIINKHLIKYNWPSNLIHSKTIEFPEGIIKICGGAMTYSAYVKGIILPDGLKIIGSGAFYNCSIKNVIIPDSVTNIGNSAFGNCNDLKNVVIPESVVEMGSSAFYRCYALKMIEIPANVVDIGYDALGCIEGLTIVGVSNSAAENYAKNHKLSFKEIGPKISINSFETELSQTNFIYSGDEKEPTVLVSSLTEDLDYIVSYKNNINVGTAVAIVTGINGYTGTITLEYTITDKDSIDNSNNSSNDKKDNDDSNDTTGGNADVTARYTVSFNANGGKVNKSSITVTKGSTYGTLPTPTRTGYTFTGWYTAKSGGSKVTSATKVNLSSAQTLYAHWTANKYKVTFHVNGGKSLASSKKTKQVTYGNTYGTLVTPTRKGYTFTGWYTKKSGGNKITKTSKVQTANAHTLYAHWKKVTVKQAGKPTLKSVKKKQLKITLKKVSAAKGYQIRYSTSAKFTKKTTHTVSTTGLSKTITKLKSGKKYYVQVRAYKLDSTKQKVYGKWSKTASKAVK